MQRHGSTGVESVGVDVYYTYTTVVLRNFAACVDCRRSTDIRRTAVPVQMKMFAVRTLRVQSDSRPSHCPDSISVLF